MPALLYMFQACRRELREIEATAVAFQVATEEATTWEFDAVRSRVVEGGSHLLSQHC